MGTDRDTKALESIAASLEKIANHLTRKLSQQELDVARQMATEETHSCSCHVTNRDCLVCTTINCTFARARDLGRIRVRRTDEVPLGHAYRLVDDKALCDIPIKEIAKSTRWAFRVAERRFETCEDCELVLRVQELGRV